MGKWKIWYKVYDKATDSLVGAGVHVKDYQFKRNAERFAKKHYGSSRPTIRFEWIISKTNPWELKRS